MRCHPYFIGKENRWRSCYLRKGTTLINVRDEIKIFHLNSLCFLSSSALSHLFWPWSSVRNTFCIISHCSLSLSFSHTLVLQSTFYPYGIQPIPIFLFCCFPEPGRGTKKLSQQLIQTLGMVNMCFQETTNARALIPRLIMDIWLCPGCVLLPVAQHWDWKRGSC